MSLLDEARREVVRGNGRGCGIGSFAATLTDADRADLAAALADDQITTSAIHKVIARRGLALQEDAVRRHRRGACSCGAR